MSELIELAEQLEHLCFEAFDDSPVASERTCREAAFALRAASEREAELSALLSKALNSRAPDFLGDEWADRARAVLDKHRPPG